jgi:uncharacterized protein (DUF305 family)
MISWKRSKVLAVSFLFVLGCGGNQGGDGDKPAEGGQAAHNDSDVTFVQAMIPHHEQAIEMSKPADSRAQTDRVKELAKRIESAQTPEIERMKSLLSSWGESMDGEGHGGHDMGAGMMSESAMAELQGVSGGSFDRMFLLMMIEHHNGAIEMADEELKNGQSKEAKDLATQIKSAQQDEVQEMQRLVQELG